MNDERWQQIIAAAFDGETAYTAEAEALCAARPECAAYAARLAATREAVTTMRHQEEISDFQFAAFMEGVREGIDRPRFSYRSWWAALSLTAAALVAALAILSLFSNGSASVRATETGAAGADVADSAVDWAGNNTAKHPASADMR